MKKLKFEKSNVLKFKKTLILRPNLMPLEYRLKKEKTFHAPPQNIAADLAL